MYYEIHGEGFPLVMIIGASASLEWWDEYLIEELSKKYKTVVFDNRGMGQTDKPDIKYSIKMFADDTAGLMTGLNIDRAHILGISMGGMIAQELVLNYPERIEKLVLCATNCRYKFSYRVTAKLFVKIGYFYVKRKMKTPEGFAETTIPRVFTEEFIKGNPDFIEEIRLKYIKYTPQFEDWKRQAEAVLKVNTRKRLKSIDTPTLILQGKKDRLISYKYALELAELIPYSNLALFENSPHHLFTEEPERVIQTLLEFLEEKSD